MNISIIETETGLKYFIVYDVVAVDYVDNRRVINSYYSKESAYEQKAFCFKTYKNLYRCFFVDEHIVWVD